MLSRLNAATLTGVTGVTGAVEEIIGADGARHQADQADRGDRADRRGNSPARRGTPPHRTTGRFSWLSPTVLWPLARHLLATGPVRPQGGGTRRADEEAVFAAVLYVLVSGESWRALPKSFPVSWQNAHRRFGQWCDEDLWNRMAATARATPRISAPVRDWSERVAAAARDRRHPCHPASPRL